MITAALNWSVGWWLVLGGFLSGAALGLGFAREDFLGGFTSWPRRMLRLGHIALIALGMLNILFALFPATRFSHAAGPCFIAGGIGTPLFCFLAAWRKPLRHLFPLSVLCLVAGVVLVLAGGLP